MLSERQTASLDLSRQSVALLIARLPRGMQECYAKAPVVLRHEHLPSARPINENVAEANALHVCRVCPVAPRYTGSDADHLTVCGPAIGVEVSESASSAPTQLPVLLLKAGLGWRRPSSFRTSATVF